MYIQKIETEKHLSYYVVDVKIDVLKNFKLK